MSRFLLLSQASLLPSIGLPWGEHNRIPRASPAAAIQLYGRAGGDPAAAFMIGFAVVDSIRVVVSMRKLQKLVSYFPVLLLGIALGSTLSNWGYLVDVGGWFALVGHFVVIAATLVFIYICGVLALSIVVAPIVILFSMRDDDSFALTKAMNALGNPRVLLAACRRVVMAIADPLWKALWWCWWFVSGRDAAEEAPRSDG
jgi:hypothetical protein